MRWPRWLTALLGALAGALPVALAPDAALFVPPAAPLAVSGAERWACPMMDYIGNAPGTCPICGMRLEPMRAGELNREQQRRLGLRTSVVVEGTAMRVLQLGGIVGYDERYTETVLARVAGRIVRRHPATFGCCQDIAAGEPIVDLDSPEAYAAQVELAAALAAGDTTRAAALDERFARWQLAPLAAAIRAGAAPSRIVTILSPASGQVWFADEEAVNRALRVGSAVAADSPLLTVVDPERRVVILAVPEIHAGLVANGQRVELAVDALGALPPLSARLGRVAVELDPRTRTREARVYLASARQLPPGATVSARLRVALAADLGPADPEDPASHGRFLQVPASAVLSTGVRHLVWRLRARQPDGTVQLEPVAVALGPRVEGGDGEERLIVRAGLRAGDEVVTHPAFLIDSQAQLAGTPSLLFPDGLPRPADAAP
ncbi:MAG: efflux RND transporter periplasmic adaptor subunit [Planctomycetota bacterium]|nr:efflux RND transporter periplasmic adaptor subunit [Planctomycetota bacterium]MDW8373677.1 efflux RND transporter periplasmic adaptor subunit [Planctomycetota bacterium]